MLGRTRSTRFFQEPEDELEQEEVAGGAAPSIFDAPTEEPATPTPAPREAPSVVQRVKRSIFNPEALRDAQRSDAITDGVNDARNGIFYAITGQQRQQGSRGSAANNYSQQTAMAQAQEERSAKQAAAARKAALDDPTSPESAQVRDWYRSFMPEVAEQSGAGYDRLAGSFFPGGEHALRAMTRKSETQAKAQSDAAKAAADKERWDSEHGIRRDTLSESERHHRAMEERAARAARGGQGASAPSYTVITGEDGTQYGFNPKDPTAPLVPLTTPGGGGVKKPPPAGGDKDMQKREEQAREIELRYSDIKSGIERLKKKIEESGTWEMLGEHNNVLDQELELIATDMAKMADPGSVARPSEVQAFKKVLMKPGLWTQNSTATGSLTNFQKILDERRGTAYSVRGLTPPGARPAGSADGNVDLGSPAPESTKVINGKTYRLKSNGKWAVEE